jgi:hypothetical protein
MRFRLISFDGDGREVGSESLQCPNHVEAAALAAGHLLAMGGWRRATLRQGRRTVASFPGPLREGVRLSR